MDIASLSRFIYFPIAANSSHLITGGCFRELDVTGSTKSFPMLGKVPCGSFAMLQTLI